MKIRMCSCLWSGLVRPPGAVKIEQTRIKSPDVLVAKLSGAVNGNAAVVKHKGAFYFVPPKKDGKLDPKAAKKIPADHLTDGLHAAVMELNILRDMKKLNRKTRKA